MLWGSEIELLTAASGEDAEQTSNRVSGPAASSKGA